MKPRPQTIVLACVLILALAVPCYVWLREPPQSENIPRESRTNVLIAPAPATSGPAAHLNTQPPARRQEELVGIGAVLKTDNETGVPMITGVVPNSPAAEAGLAGNFIIRKIDDTIIAGMKLPECVDLIRGPAGSKVRLELFDVDANEARTVELTRRKIQL